MESQLSFDLLNEVVSYFFARLFNNAFGESCAAFLLSDEGVKYADSNGPIIDGREAEQAPRDPFRWKRIRLI